MTAAMPVVGPSRPGPDDERGATLALTALVLTGLLAVTAMVIDIGDARLKRRNLVPATDAAALAAVQELVERPWDSPGACSAAAGYLALNAPDATMTTCDVVVTSADGGRIAVGSDEALDAVFVEPNDPAASTGAFSAAAWGPPLTVSGLRPVAFCYDGSPELQNLIDNPPSGPSWVTVQLVKSDPAACGGLASVGNFLSVDFDGGASVAELRDWVTLGHPGQVTLDDNPATSCAGDVVCFDRPYVLPGSIIWQLNELRNSQEYVAFPVYDFADADGVHIIGVVRARLYDYYFYGDQAGWNIELKVDPGLIAGTCCGSVGLVSGNKTTVLCGVDPGAFAACAPETTP